MSDGLGPETTADDQRAELAAAFDQELDPLAEYEVTFRQTDADAFGLFTTEVLASRNITQRTHDGYDRVFRQWRAFMAKQDRHPACPNEEHVKAFAHHELDTKDNHPDTVKEKLRKLNDLYRYWQDDPSFPHPQDYNPIALARAKITFADAERKEPPQIPIPEIRDVLESVTVLRDWAIIVLQLKLGLRATEVCNLQLADIALDHSDLTEHYPELGSNPYLADHENTIFIPHDRDGNKSPRPRLLPLDADLRSVLRRYLLIRPDTGGPHVFLSQSRHEPLQKEDVNTVWKDAFHPAYAETEHHRAVTSHYGRHYFTTYWRVQQDLNRELIRYMRGDAAGAVSIQERGGIDEYIHTYYEDIAEIYRERMFTVTV
ncbi:tyrosine-type recombinase/integrase [Halosimplex salinum]|uniref:tyrosine-type recombinase/integrase n=1 Tax=Halosimplex salinum TaxID=1710538 RepID=UPI000F477E3E|nr:site-specific integrase [Halosimplex salinum]